MPSIFLIQYSVSLRSTSQYGSKNGRKLPVHVDFKNSGSLMPTKMARRDYNELLAGSKEEEKKLEVHVKI